MGWLLDQLSITLKELVLPSGEIYITISEKIFKLRAKELKSTILMKFVKSR